MTTPKRVELVDLLDHVRKIYHEGVIYEVKDIGDSHSGYDFMLKNEEGEVFVVDKVYATRKPDDFYYRMYSNKKYLGAIRRVYEVIDM